MTLKFERRMLETVVVIIAVTMFFGFMSVVDQAEKSAVERAERMGWLCGRVALRKELDPEHALQEGDECRQVRERIEGKQS